MKTLICFIILSIASVSYSETYTLYDVTSTAKEYENFARYKPEYFETQILKSKPKSACKYNCTKDYVVIEFEKNGKDYRFWTHSIDYINLFSYNYIKKRGFIIYYDDNKQIVGTGNVLDEIENRNHNRVVSAPEYPTDKELREVTRKVLKGMGRLEK